MGDVSLPIAFFAGLVSFLSPCVLPLVPGYLSYMSGLTIGSEGSTLKTTRAALAFVLGFSVIFIAFGATATALGSFLNAERTTFARIGGVFIILMGLLFMGVLKVPFLYREARFHPSPKAGLWGSVVLGGAFAFGWSPCIGATLGAVLTMAGGNSSTGSVGEGAFLLAVYSLGLGVPFVLSALGVTRLTAFLSWFRRHVRVVNLASGTLLVVVGVLFLTEQIFRISAWLQQIEALQALWVF